MTTTDIGRAAERIVCAWLRDKDIEILQTNIRLGRGEVDILARDGVVILVVEVRTRGPGSYTSALASITRDKRRRIVSAAKILWRTRFKKMEGVERMRFDVAAVTLSDPPAVDYVKAAFTEE